MLLPEGFVYLDEVVPSVTYVMSYATTQNFIGSIIDGYFAPVAIVTMQAAIALESVQHRLQQDGFSLVIYDAYRPQKAVDHFMYWGADLVDTKMQRLYYPSIHNKSDIFKRGYVAENSAHSRGSTVDVSIIKKDAITSSIQVNTRVLNDGREVCFLDDGSEDMYTSFDLFDEASWQDTKLVPILYLEKRQYLRNIMLKNGFVGYSKEWWHFTLAEEPFGDKYFNFDVNR